MHNEIILRYLCAFLIIAVLFFVLLWRVVIEDAEKYKRELQMNAYSELVTYLDQHEMHNATEHADAVIDIVLRILSEQRPTPKKFVVMPKKAFMQMYVFEESNVIGQFPLPVDLDQLGGALKMLSAGIAVQTPNQVIIPYPSLIIKPHEFE